MFPLQDLETFLQPETYRGENCVWQHCTNIWCTIHVILVFHSDGSRNTHGNQWPQSGWLHRHAALYCTHKTACLHLLAVCYWIVLHLLVCVYFWDFFFHPLWLPGVSNIMLEITEIRNRKFEVRKGSLVCIQPSIVVL